MRAIEWGKEEESDFASSIGHGGEGIRVIRRLEAVGNAHGCGNLQLSQNPWPVVVRTEAAGSWHRWRGRTAPRARAASLCRVGLTGQIGGGFGLPPVEVP
jgi:hypothetical protein